MTHLIRGKQAGVQNDLSAGILPEFFAADQVMYNPYIRTHVLIFYQILPVGGLTVIYTHIA